MIITQGCGNHQLIITLGFGLVEALIPEGPPSPEPPKLAVDVDIRRRLYRVSLDGTESPNAWRTWWGPSEDVQFNP